MATETKIESKGHATGDVKPAREIEDDAPDTPDNYVDCYNCTGANTHIECGFPSYGCELCRKHGNSRGLLLREFATSPVTISFPDGTLTFEPPPYSCMVCKDKKTFNAKIWDPVIAKKEPICSDNNDHLMPKVEVACYKCMRSQYEKEFDAAKKTYFASRT